MRLAIITVILFFSCNNNPDGSNNKRADSSQQKGAGKIIAEPATELSDSCYWKITGRDTLVAWLVEKDNKIAGTLNFDNFQKDGSSGTLTGTIEDNIIKLWYSFESEGMKSVLEVWFKKQESRLVRGVGPSGVKNDTSYFTDPSAVRFDTGQTLLLVDCALVPGKYK